MKKPFLFILKTLVSGFFWIPMFLAVAGPSDILSTPDLIKALQSGGHIIYMRHGETEITQKDRNSDTFDDCNNQRNLSETGRNQVTMIGLIIRKLEIPIGNVTSSPYCRTKDTAKLTFGEFHTEPKLQFSISKNKEEAKILGEHLHTMMLNSEIDTKNEVFVGHTANLKDGLGIWPKPEGVLVIFQKREGKLIFKGMIKPNEWPQ